MKKTLLLITLCFSLTAQAQIVDCSELFFSEYLEGYSQNKALEIYNPTNNTIDLSTYQIERYSNGNVTSALGGITSLSGMIAPKEVFVITNGETDTAATFGYCDPILYALGDFAEPNGSYPTPLHMNGNDAMVLTNGSVIVDVIGRVGEDPGVCWTDNAASGFVSGTSAAGFNPGTWYTTGQTLIRKSNVKYGDNNGIDLFNPSLEWDTLPPTDWSNLGSHTCDCNVSSDVKESNKNITYVLYPNPAKKGEVITIGSKLAIRKVDVFNLLAERVISTSNNIISANELSSGKYLIDITFQDGRSVTNKLIVE
tara:strand:+ start:11280 stop:12212 length:933 start_codon:yes stop_codon:yes gene_type:complete